MIGINSTQVFRGTITIPGARKYPQKGLIIDDHRISTDNIKRIQKGFRKDETLITFKDNSPMLSVCNKEINTKDIISAYAAAKDSDVDLLL